MSHLGETVDDDKDSVITLLRSGKSSNKVHLDLIPFPFRYFKWLQKSSRPLMFSRDATANVTLGHIACKVFFHIWPPEPLSDVLVHLGTTRMNRQRCIMSFLHYFICDIVVF